MKGYQAQGTGAWASGGNMNTARNSPDGSGNSNNALIASGGYDGTGVVSITESWDGSSWTEVGDMNTGKSQGATSGHAPSLATIHFGGGPAVANAETWNGSAWTEVSEINNARSRAGASGVSNTAALVYAGEDGPSPDYTGNTESWDGTSWTEVADMSTARYGLTGGGGAMPNATALASGGYTNSSSGMNNTEEWSFPSAPGVLEGQMWIKTATGASSVMKG